MKSTNYLIGSFLLLAAIALILLVILKPQSTGSQTETTTEEPEIAEIRQDISTLEQLPESTLPVMKMKNGSAEVYLQSLDIQVEVTGNIAVTRYVMVFKNRTRKVLEGELLFPLPNGVTVSHYALDINGKMREAVPVPKARATQVFEEIEQRRVDPGLLERVEGNNFRTRIYPIPANGTRTISIGYEEELTAEKGYFYYRLPMAYKEAIEKFSIKASVWKTKSKPQLLGQMADELTFDEQGENYVASFSRNNYQAGKALIFALPAPLSVPQVLIQPDSENHYFLASCMTKTKNRKKSWGNTLAVIWDASLSGSYRDHVKELDVLEKIIKEKKNLSINLYFLNNRLKTQGTYKITNGDWQELGKAIESAVYDGGTNFNAIRFDSVPGDEILFFSDGLSTLSDANFIVKSETAGRPVHCIVSSAKAGYSAMKWIAAQTNGKFINLNALFDEQIQHELLFETLHFMGIETNRDVREVYPSVATPVKGNFSIAGILDAPQTGLVLLFGYGNKVEQRIIVNLDTTEATRQANVDRIWAQKKINELDMCYEQNKKELTKLGQQFGIVTRNTSLIVLETLWDYIRYGITPPAGMQEELDEFDRFNSIVEDEWGESNVIRFMPPPMISDVVQEQDRDNQLSVEMKDEMKSIDEISTIQEEQPQTDVKKSVTNEKEKNYTYNNIRNVSQPVIKLLPVKQDNSYTKELTGNLDNDYAVYLRLRPGYINTPTFYFDMADWFFKHNDRDRALLILTSIADLELENASLFRLLGYRFKEYGEYDLEAYVCKKVIQWRPLEPQSYRDYALALVDNGKHQEALDNLCVALDRFERQR